MHANINKRHAALSFHRVGEAILSKMVSFYHVSGGDNPADILSKHWSYTKIWGIFQILIFWMGDIIDFLDLKLNMGGGQGKGE